MPLRVGAKLYGYCGGAFGRDSFGVKTVEAIGVDWVVVRGGQYGQDDHVMLYVGKPEDLLEYAIKPPDWED